MVDIPIIDNLSNLHYKEHLIIGPYHSSILLSNGAVYAVGSGRLTTISGPEVRSVKLNVNVVKISEHRGIPILLSNNGRLYRLDLTEYVPMRHIKDIFKYQDSDDMLLLDNSGHLIVMTNDGLTRIGTIPDTMFIMSCTQSEVLLCEHNRLYCMSREGILRNVCTTASKILSVALMWMSEVMVCTVLGMTYIVNVDTCTISDIYSDGNTKVYCKMSKLYIVDCLGRLHTMCYGEPNYYHDNVPIRVIENS